jgi:hypothetical protein
MRLPVTVYRYDRGTKDYRFSHCLTFTVPDSPPPAVLNCSTAMGVLRDGLELLKAAMRAPAVVLINGARSKALSASGEEVASMPPMLDAQVVVPRFRPLVAMQRDRGGCRSPVRPK